MRRRPSPASSRKDLLAPFVVPEGSRDGREDEVSTDREQVQRNVATVVSGIADAASRVGRDPRDVSLIAVTKTVDVERIRWAVDAGVQRVGGELRPGASPEARRDPRGVLALHRDAAVEHRAPGRRSRRRGADDRGGASGATPRRSGGSLRTVARCVDRGRPDGWARRGSPRRAPRVRGSRRLARGTATRRPHDDAPDPRGPGRLPPVLRGAPATPGSAPGTASGCAGIVDGDVVGLRGRGGRRRYDGPHRDRGVRAPSSQVPEQPGGTLGRGTREEPA